ncbi:MAG: VanZ family protein [Eubacterium sp.]
MEKILHTLYINILYYLRNYLLIPFFAALLIAAAALFISFKKDKSSVRLDVYIRNNLINKNYFARFLLCFYLMIDIQSTVISRFDNPKQNPLSDIWGGWLAEETLYFYDLSPLWNIVLFLPMCFAMAYYAKTVKGKSFGNKALLLCSMLYSFCASLFIEVMQLVFCVGTIQFSDIFYNTLGGLLGAVIFIILRKFKGRTKKSFHENKS